MRAKLEVALLGPPLILLHGRPVTDFKTLKAQALLYYLAATGRHHTRSSLAGLLWGGMDETHARVNLSKALSEVRAVLGDYLIADRLQVHFDPQSDFWLDLYDQQARSEELAAGNRPGTDLYRGDFLEDFYVRDAPEFEMWMLAERERQRERAVQLLEREVERSIEQGSWQTGIHAARRLLDIEPWRESAHRRLMMLLAESGQRAAALQQYEKLRQILDMELGVEPSPETLQLRAQIQAGDLPAQPVSPSGEVRSLQNTAPTGRFDLPTPATAFIGRAKELAEIRRILADPECRLLTLVGPGGMGKTRLAIQAAQQVIDSGVAAQAFADGVYFVQLAPATDINGLAATIAQAILTDLFGNGLSPQQLLDFLAGKRLLVVLDNFEHLRDATPLLAEILARAPGVKLLVTSREAVNLTEAWLYPVGGLPVAPEDQDGQTEPDAVRLFVASARRKQPGFVLARHTAEVTTICRTVGGMPLAIELAAAWLNVMPPAAIAAELQRGLDLLTSRNTVLPRHRSIRVVLEESWRLLSLNDAEVFNRLAVFRGGFRPEAGVTVAGASAATLAGLVDCALIQLDETGRFQIHELLHQVAAEELAQDDEARTAAHTRHSRYYLALLDPQYNMLAGNRLLAAIEVVRNDFENIAAAWQWAVDHADYASLGQALLALNEFCAIQGRFVGSVALFEQLAGALAAREDLAQHHSLYARVLACLGYHLFRVDRCDEALACARRSLEFAEDERDRAFALLRYGAIENFIGQRAEAIKLVSESAALSRKAGSPVELVHALNEWAVAMPSQSYRAAQQISREAVAVGRQTGRLDIIAVNLANLGWLDTGCGDYDDALAHLREALAIAEQLGSRVVIGLTDNKIAWAYISMGEPGHPDVLPCLRRAISLAQDTGERSVCARRMSEYALALFQLGQVDQAVTLGRQAATIARETNNHLYSGIVFAHYGGILTGAGAFAEAYHALRESLAATYPNRIDSIVLFALCYLGELLIAENCQGDLPKRDAHLRQAAALLTVVAANPAAEHYFKVKAERLLAALEPAYLPDDTNALSIEAVVPELLDQS